MFFGPVFTRELTIAPRREQTYLIRGTYVGLLLLVVATSWLVVTGTQVIRDTGDFARFGSSLFGLLAPLQLGLAMFFSAILAAAAVAQEKDRQTLILLLLTHLSNRELVLGKLMAALLNVFVMLFVSVPVFMLVSLLGGISYSQIARVLLVTFFCAAMAGSLGSCIALWREKTFQAIATTILLIVMWLMFWEAVAFGWLGSHWFSIPCVQIAAAASPWDAVMLAARPVVSGEDHWLIAQFLPIVPFLLTCGALTILINLTAVAMVRIWNPSRELRQGTILEDDTWRKGVPTHEVSNTLEETLAGHKLITENAVSPAIGEKKTPSISAAPGKVKHAWDNPIIWREICTRAYGRKTMIIRFAYVLFFVMCFLSLHSLLAAHEAVTIAQLAGPLVPLFLLSLVLVNAQAITSLTSERDGRTFDLILVSDITPKEFVFGKLGGIFFNMKEMVLLPLIICGYVYYARGIDIWAFSYLFLGLTTLYVFVATVGVHIGMQYENTRSALATSLGIVFFLFLGIASCIWILVAFSGVFEVQFAPFLAFMIGGAIGLYVTLGARNPSSAIMLASILLPFFTFYAITSLLLGQLHLAFLAVVGAYGFTVAAMLVPAIAEFDVATGRTTID